MKLFCITFVFSVLTSIVSTVNAAPCASENCTADQKNSNAIRQYAGLGTKDWSKMAFKTPSKGWFKTEWNKVMGKIVNDPKTCAFDKHYPSMVAKIRWADAYIDSSIKPTRSQARNPNWSNYIWNHPENGDGFVYDGITDALNDPLIKNGKGQAKLAVIVSLTSTAHKLSPPVWMRNDKSLTWVEGTNKNGISGHWHVRFDNPQAVDHAADFLTAFLAKYGNNKGMHSVILGEYYAGQKQYRPSGLNSNKYAVGVKNLWGKAVEAAPRDNNGQRINILQTNPTLNANVTLNDMEALGIGISESDTTLDFSPATDMRKLYDGKKVHVMINGDARYACNARKQGWDGTPNPFGHKKGYSAVATPQELFWFHSEKGPAPTHSFFLRMATHCKGAPQTPANFIDAIKKFGRCGSKATKWGAAPAAFPAANDAGLIAPGKPNPPPAVAIK